MERIIKYMLVVLLAMGIPFLTGCQTVQRVDPDSYKIVISTISPVTEEESALYNTYYQSNSVASTETVTFCGKEYLGEYYKSLYTNSHRYPVDQYFLKRDGEKGYFQTRADTGELVHIWFYYTDDQDKEGKPLNESALDDLARLYASNFGSLDGRQMSRTIFSSGDIYEYSFVRYVNNCKTEDKIYVRLMADGTLYGVNAGCVGMFTEGAYKTETDILNPETCKELIRQKSEHSVVEIGELTYHITMSGKVFVNAEITLSDGDSQYKRPVFLWVEWKSEEDAIGSS